MQNRISVLKIFPVILIIAFTALGYVIGNIIYPKENSVLTSKFDGTRAKQYLETQVAFGSRAPGSPGHEQIIEWIKTELENFGWDVNIQKTEYQGQPVQNIIGLRKRELNNDAKWFIIGAHYDTRIAANRDTDPVKSTQYVPGANDGASGVAVLLELARILPPDPNLNIWLVFFDAEDNGNLAGWDWILGSRAFVADLRKKPDAAIIVDMIGDKNLNIYMEGNSTPGLTASIWKTALDLGYTQFIPLQKYTMIDDHIPFLEAGIPAVDIIDFDYPYWHTSADTPDKTSAQSLEAVGQTLYVWLTKQTGLMK